jgi:inhibitor of KinA
MSPHKIHHAGDRAIVVEFGDKIDPILNMRVLSLSARLEALALAGILETVPTFRSLMVHYDPFVLTAAELISAIERLTAADEMQEPVGRLWRLPVCYDARVAEDTAFLVQHVGISHSHLVELHSSRVYTVYMLGFLPGQPYLGDLPSELQLPRRNNPRTKIPAGSVGIATSLTCIYPMETPCGWHLIGRTPIKLWRQDPDPRPLLAPGDQVKFDPISLEEFEDLSSQSAQHLPVPTPMLQRAGAAL